MIEADTLGELFQQDEFRVFHDLTGQLSKHYVLPTLIIDNFGVNLLR